MRNFFSKIAKGFREIGKGLKTFFKSKIGRILGTVLLAIAIPAAIGAISGAGAGAGAGAAAGSTSGAATGAATGTATGTASSAIAAAEATAAASQSATLGAATQTGVALQSGAVAGPGLTLGNTAAGSLTSVGAGGVGGGSLNLASGSTGASLLKGSSVAADLTVASPGMTLGSTVSDGLVSISSHADAVNFSTGLADSFAASNPTQVYTSVSDIGQAVTKQPKLFAAESVLADSTAISKSAQSATESFRHFDQLGKIDGVSELTADININNGLGKNSLNQVSKESLTNQYNKLIQADSFNGLPISQQEIVLQKALTPSSQWAKSFSSPTFRNSYGNFIAKEGTVNLAETGLQSSPFDLAKVSEIPGVRQFGSTKEAWQAGDSLLSKAGNVMGNVADTSFSEYTKGLYTGPGGGIDAASAGFTAATVGPSLFAKAPEPPSNISPTTLGVAANIQNVGADFTQNTAPITTDTYSQQMANYNGSNFLGFMNDIHKKAGISQTYGHNSFNTGFIG